MKIPPFLGILIFLWIAHFLVDVMLGIWPVYKSLVQLDLAKAGLIVAAGALLGEGAQLIFGTLSDKGYRQAVVTWGLLTVSAAAFLAYFTNHWALFTLYLLTCTGSGAFHPAAAGLVNTLNPNKRGLLMSIFASGGSLGMAMSQLIFTYTYSSLSGYEYLLAVPAFILVLFFLFYRFPKPAVSETAKKENFHWMDFFSFFKRWDLLTLYVALVANQTILWGTIFILPDVLKTLDHGQWVCYGGGHLCFILGGTTIMIPSGYLADKYSARAVMLYGSIISFIAFYSLLFFGNFSSIFTLVNLYVLGASLIIIHPIGVSLGVKLIPSKPSTVSAFLMGMVWCISEALGPGGVGMMTKLFIDYAPVKALALLGFFFIGNLYAVWLLPKAEQVLESSEI